LNRLREDAGCLARFTVKKRNPDGMKGFAATIKILDAMITRLGIDSNVSSEHNYMYVNPAEV
jgi:hypothetical protein